MQTDYLGSLDLVDCSSKRFIPMGAVLLDSCLQVLIFLTRLKF
jgi:hypothetical protein